MIITISGTPGSGKSTVAKMLARKLKLKHYSTGDFMREMAQERNLSLEQFGELAKTDPAIDRELDERQKNLGKEEDNFIIDARLGFHFLPQSIKLFITADISVRAQRIFADAQQGKRTEEQAKSWPEMKQKIEKRKQSEMVRYKKYYGLNPYDQKNYDFVVDSSAISAEQVVEKIQEYLRRHKR